MGIRQREFAGTEFVQFYGVVEDRNDPLHVGRVRVRCYGWHTSNKTELPTSSLPWAQVMTSVNNAAMSGIGISATGLVEGTTVVGFFMDGRNAQRPLILGSMPGISSAASGQNDQGFSDPNGTYPLETGYPDTPKLAYDRSTDDPITEAKSTVETVPTVDGEWTQPDQRGGAESRYPYNHVWQFEGGHAFEVDNTPGAERIHVYHKMGTFVEIQPDGTRVTKIVGDDYEIVVAGKNVTIKGPRHIPIAATASKLITGNYDLKVEGVHTIHNDVIIKGKSIAEDDHLSGAEQISGKGHTHTDTAGLGAGITTVPNP